MVVGGPGVVVRGGPLGEAKWLSKANLNGNMEVIGIVSFIEQFGG